VIAASRASELRQWIRITNGLTIRIATPDEGTIFLLLFH